MDWAWRVCVVFVVGLLGFHFIYSAGWASAAGLATASIVGWFVGVLALVALGRRRAGHNANDGR